MPEEYLWITAGYLGHLGLLSMALYIVTLFDTYLRPTTCRALGNDDIVAPVHSSGEEHYVLLVAAFEKEKATKTGYYDEALVLDGDLCPQLGALLVLQGQRAQRLFGPKSNRLWDFAPRAFYESWRGAVHKLGLQGMESVHQARHGGASRDLLKRRRTEMGVAHRGGWASMSTLRIYNKPARILQLVNELEPSMIEYSGQIRNNFAKWFQSGAFPPPPIVIDH